METENIPELEHWLTANKFYINFDPTGQATGIHAVCDGDVTNYVEKINAAHAAEIERLQKDLQTLLKLMAQDREKIERLKAALDPRTWTLEMSTAWHSNIPNTEKAFEALRKAGGVTK